MKVAEEFSTKGTVSRAETMMDKLKAMAATVRGKSREVINQIVNVISMLISKLREWSSSTLNRYEELKDVAGAKASRSVEELKHQVADTNLRLKEGAKRLVEDCKEGVEKLTQRFKT